MGKKFTIHRQFGSAIGSVVEDANRNIWIHAPHDAKTMVFKFDASSRNLYPFKRNPSVRHDSFDNMVKSIFCDSQGFVWQASVGKLEKFNHEGQTFYTVDIPPVVQPITSFIDSQGTIWLG